MKPPTVDPARITGYHAHVYYDAATRAAAARLRAAIERRFSVRMGRWHDKPVGPHPVSMYQVAFDAAEFERIVPWLMTNRAGLDILVHPETGNAYDDHVHHSLWLGRPLALVVDALR